MLSLKPGFHRYLGVMICILLTLTITAPPITVAGAASGRRLNIFYVAPLGEYKICLFSKESLGVTIYDAKQILDVPVAGASVLFQSDTGKQTVLSSGDGSATYSYSAKTEGQHTISATATKVGYTSDSATFAVTVVKCSWDFTLHYKEGYSVFGNKGIVVSADELYLATFTVDDNGNLVPEGDPAIHKYQFLASDTLMPLDVGFIRKDTSGNFDVQVKGQVSESGVRLQLSSKPIPLDLMIQMGFTDVSHTRIIQPLAPVATTGEADLLGKIGLHSIGFGEGGGAYEAPVGPKIFINSSNRLFALVSVRIDPVKP